MTCPYCTEKNILTWKVYIIANFRHKYKCINCHKQFKTKSNILQKLELSIIALIIIIPITLIGHRIGFSLINVLFLSLTPMVFVLSILDKHYDENAETIKTKSEPDREEFK